MLLGCNQCNVMKETCFAMKKCDSNASFINLHCKAISELFIQNIRVRSSLIGQLINRDYSRTSHAINQVTSNVIRKSPIILYARAVQLVFSEIFDYIQKRQEFLVSSLDQ